MKRDDCLSGCSVHRAKQIISAWHVMTGFLYSAPTGRKQTFPACGLWPNFLSQRPQSEKVRESHDSVDQVGALPHEVHGNDGAQINHYNIEQLVERDTAASAEIFRSLFPEIGPADQGGHSEGAQGDREKGVPHIGQMGKSGGGQIRFGCPGGGGRVIEHVADHHKPGQQTHHYRVPENGCHGDIGLYAGFSGVGSSGGDGGCADAGLVCEKPSGNAVAQRPLYACSCHAPGQTGKGESVRQNPDHSGEQLVTVETQEKDAAEQVQKSDGGHGALAETADASDAAQNDRACDHGKGDAYGVWGNAKA